ncbi:hypothetical protein [[Phormidium ambiguum] IAM M-71]|uniref:hypothetical protein n=1 Tax=[Phormidium ambiguum] IAM M-71 TaxID=454136 RepID=UPI0015B88252|nr:hypothetical protein [Phormidium ambiguum]
MRKGRRQNRRQKAEGRKGRRQKAEGRRQERQKVKISLFPFPHFPSPIQFT